MIYKNIDIHNAAELDISDADGSMTWLCAPRRVYDSIETGNGRRMLRGSTGGPRKKMCKQYLTNLDKVKITDISLT